MRTAIAIATLLLFAAPALGAGVSLPGDGYITDDLSLLPDAVAAKRERLLEAAKSGDMDELEALMLVEPGVNVSFGDPEDPVAYLKEQSADGEGRETLAILAELLEAPYAAFDSGNGELVYVWPYLAAVEDLGKMDAADEVVAIRLLGYEKFTQMRELGSWYNWRVYLGADGQWQAFVAGD